jgi:hypothetical protein
VFLSLLLYLYPIHIKPSMHALVLTPFQHQGPASAANSLDFPNGKTCNDVSTKRSMETIKTSSGASAKCTAVYVPK